MRQNISRTLTYLNESVKLSRLTPGQLTMRPIAAISQQIWDMKYRLKSEGGTPVANVRRQIGISEATFQSEAVKSIGIVVAS